MALSDRLFEPRSRLPRLRCELPPHTPNRLDADTHPLPHILRMFSDGGVCSPPGSALVCSGVVLHGTRRRAGAEDTGCLPHLLLPQTLYPVNRARMCSASCAVESVVWLPPQRCQISLYSTVRCRVSPLLGGQTSLSPVLPYPAIAASAGRLSACVTANHVSAILDMSKGCRHTLLYSSANELVC